ncbi:hypothetical protein GUITHDRAFT_120923 [Guillardia theta CCMP2712]|uniref:PDZ domain-containing protein n=1 Tax=Guillardia theta (strain CCMP2712) TaxID=905079 RepID=L1I9K0_GUITC|nr:hypothetical protein GUITHDRAFT_120923 [Guillardia theta CCMP2712]EKX32898.1 hypothetical protein GUITHDRAFT_120923 [Guillardia theta CCMP2712]|eukprot:XP_005819878.1 hypothetical protein GUITHDRAFT_120923 [Guillardia theta CCMP2712]
MLKLKGAVAAVMAAKAMEKQMRAAKFMRNPKEVIAEFQREHAFVISGSTGTTIGVILTGCRVKFVIPGSPGSRPIVGKKLEIDDQILAVDDRPVDPETVVDAVRGSNIVGSKVSLKVRRAGSGLEQVVVCVRAPLNFVEDTKDMYLLLEEARLYRGVGTLISKIEQKFSQLESNHELLQEHMRRTICALEAELESNINETQEILHEIDGEEGVEGTSGEENLNQRIEHMQHAIDSIEKCFENLHPNESLLLDKSLTPCARGHEDDRLQQDIEALLRELENEKKRREMVENQAKLFGEEFMQLSHQWQTEKQRLEEDLQIMEVRCDGDKRMLEEMSMHLQAKDGEIVALQEQLHASDLLVQEAKDRTDSLAEMLKSKSNSLAMEAKKLQEDLQASKDAYATLSQQHDELQQVLCSEREKYQQLQVRKDHEAMAESSPNPVSDVQRLEMNPSRALEPSAIEKLETGPVMNPTHDSFQRMLQSGEEEEQLNFVADRLSGSSGWEDLYGDGLPPSVRKFVLKRVNSRNRTSQLAEYFDAWAWRCLYKKQRHFRISKARLMGLKTLFNMWMHYIVQKKGRKMKEGRIRGNSMVRCSCKAFAALQGLKRRSRMAKRFLLNNSMFAF